jgi:hypothetical protein
MTSYDMPMPGDEPTTTNDGESVMPALPSPEVRKKLPAVTMLLDDQHIETLIDWGSTTNVVNPLRVNTAGAIPLGKCLVKFDGVFESTSTPTIELERVLLRVQATKLMKPVMMECWLCSKVNFSALLAHYMYDAIYSGQSHNDDEERFLTVRSTQEKVPYWLVDANLNCVRAIQDQTQIVWSSIQEVQFAPAAYALVEMTPNLIPVSPANHMFELHPDMANDRTFAVQDRIPVFDQETGTYGVVVQNMSTQPLLLKQGRCLLISRQAAPVLP